MKKATFIIAFLCSITLLQAQKTPVIQSEDNKAAGFITATNFHITRPLSEIAAENPIPEDMVHPKANRESKDRKHRIPQTFEKTGEDGPEFGNDPNSIQDKMGDVDNKAPIQNWAGQTAAGFRPFDPSGAAGPNHYVQAINSTTFRVYNKSTGATMLTATVGSLWSPPTANDGDPIVMYDKAADRWFISQFGSAGNNIFIAISTTNNPTGSYYTWTFTSPAFPDYLKFGVWQDGYYMTSNQPQKVFAFERTAMLAGTPGARAVYQTFSPPQGGGFFVPMPGDAADGTLPPAGTPCPIFSYSDNGWGGGFNDAVNIYRMTVNWVPVTPTANIVSAGVIPTAAFDASYSPSWDDCVQPGTTQRLDGIGGVIMYRAQWKSWGTYNTVVLNWAVRISATQRSIKWCELRQNPGTGVWSMYQEGIYTPDASTRWMGGIAMDNNGAIALTYIKSNSSSIYPGLYYAGRRPCDPLGTMPVTESVAQAGTGSQTGAGNRDGDYSQLVLDPDGITFWNTSEYMGGTTGPNAARTRIYSFQLPTCGPAAPVANFIADNTTPCIGATVNFTDISTNTPTSWAWSFSPTSITYVGGTSAASQNPQVQFSTVGPYTVTLTATNASGSDPEVKTNYIIPITAGALPLMQNFEGATFPPTGWVVQNNDAPSIVWGTAGAKGLERRAAAGNTGSTSGSAGIECFNYNTDTMQVDNLISPAVSLVGATAPQMTFKRAHKYYNDATNPNNYHDELRVYISTDCGLTYGPAVYYKKDPQLASNGTLNTTFTPAVTLDWDTDTVSLTPYIGQNIFVKFEVTNRYGNNLYIDDVNINNVAGSCTTTASNTGPVCAGGTFNLATTSAGGGYTYSWAGPSGYSSSVQNPTGVTAPAVAGTYNYTVTATNGGTTCTSVTAVTVNAIPATPTASSSSPDCTGQTISLTTPTVAGATYSWTGPSGYTSTSQNPTRPSATTAMAGTYSVTVTVAGCTSAAGTTTVVVNTTPATPTASSSSPDCTGQTISLTTPTVAGATYAWTGPSGYTSTSQNPTRPSATTAMAGTYSVTVTVGGCTSAAGTTTVVVNTTPTISVNSPTICPGGTATLTGVGGTTYAWSTGASTNPINVSPGATTTYTVTGTTSGCQGTAVATVTVAASLAITVNSPTICTGQSATLTAGGGTTYSWSTGSTSNPIIVSPAGTTSYTVTGTTAGCTGTAVSTVTVNPNPVVGVNSPTICSGATATLTGTGATTYAWSTGASTNPIAVTPATTTSYTVTGTTAGCQGTAVSTVTVNPSPVVTVNSPTICSGQTATLTAGGATTYSWSAGATPTGVNTADASPSTTTSYTVTGTTAGCQGTAVATVTVNPTPPTPTIMVAGLTLTSSSATGNQWYLNGVLIPGATGQNYTVTANGNYTVVVTIAGCSSAPSAITIVTSVGIDGAENPYFLLVSPNPNDGNFEVSFNANVTSDYTLELTNALGQLVFKEVLNNFNGKYSKRLNVTEYGKGMYMLSLTNSKNETVKKIVVY